MSSRTELRMSDGDREVGGEGTNSVKAKEVNLISPEAPAICRKNAISIADVLSRPKRNCSRFDPPLLLHGVIIGSSAPCDSP